MPIVGLVIFFFAMAWVAQQLGGWGVARDTLPRALAGKVSPATKRRRGARQGFTLCSGCA